MDEKEIIEEMKNFNGECTSEETVHPDGRKDVKITAPHLVSDLRYSIIQDYFKKFKEN